MNDAGIRIPWSVTVESLGEMEAKLAAGEITLPAIVRPAFTMGGQGGGIGRDETELRQVVTEGLAASPINQVLVEESVIGWGEFELEVMRDRNDNVVIICSIENVDPMGVHTGDSVTVAPAQTLTDPLYQDLRDQAIKVIRAIGVETGGSNVQFAVNPENGEIAVIEMNPRVSRSSALASKATGFPIAKMAAKLAVGYALEEIPNDITRATPASFEPTIDYVVTKIPRFAFEKFPGSEGRLSTYMQSVGEAMAIGRTFRESFAKAMRSRELDSAADIPESEEDLLAAIEVPCAERFDLIHAAFERGLSVEAVHEACLVDPWFLRELQALATEGDGTDGLVRTYKAVDTCAAEFEAATPYYYSAHERPRHDGAPPANEIRRGENDSVVILGAGPNRIGQGIEFDYCCVHAAMTARELGPRRGDGQLQPGDRLHRLRHLRSPLLRAVDGGGRARRLRAGAPGGRDRPVRRPDAAEARPHPRRGGSAPAGDAGRRDRPGRGPGPLRRAARTPRGRGAALRHRLLGRGSDRGRRTGRVPAAGPALLRARRPGDGDLLLDRRT